MLYNKIKFHLFIMRVNRIKRFFNYRVIFVAFEIYLYYNKGMEKSIKILVISNTRGNTGPILTAIDKEHPDVIFHLGDGVSDLADLNFAGKIYAVRSGGEFGRQLPTATKISFGSEIMLLSHCDYYEASDKQKLTDFATAQGATILLFGSEDKPAYFEQNGIKFVCPGSLHERMSATYVIMEMDENGALDIKHCQLIEQ